MMKKRKLLVILLVCLLSACATAPADPAALAAYKENNDPLEPMNRKIFAFNMAADKYVLHPVGEGYRYVTTPDFRKGVRTFFSNLKTPLTVVNDVLQGNLKNAGLDLSRFAINTTLGVFGIFDVADRMGIAPNRQGFGTTMAVWGIDPGPYLVLPLLGSSNVRDFTGMVADWGLDPLTYAAYSKDNHDMVVAFWSADIVEGLATYENVMDLMSETQKTSLDFYAYMRSMYRQYRRTAIDRAKGINPENDDKKASYEFSLDEDFDED